MTPQQLAQAQATKEINDWNARVRVGDEVEYRAHRGAQSIRLRTKTLAQLLGGVTPIVWLEGKSGCVALNACVPVAPPAVQEKPTGWVRAWAIVDRQSKKISSLCLEEPLQVTDHYEVVELGGVTRT